MAQYKALILYASYGDGHVQVSRALREALHERDIDSVLVDLMALSHPLIDAFCRRFYVSSYSLFPHIYGWLYRATDRLRPGHPFLQGINSLGRTALASILREEEPDLVLNTFPMPALPAARKDGTPIPTCTVLTDFTAHARWLHADVNAYYVATGDLARELADRGIAPERVKVSGIPTKARFRRPVGCDRIHARFGLTPGKRTLLVMAGPCGVLKGLEQIRETLLCLPDLQAVFVCGNNRYLRAKLEHTFRHSSNIRVFGYVEDISMLMSISFGLVTKPGGVTLSEALTANLPPILYRPVPGQERANAGYLAAKGAALIAGSGSELSSCILRLLRDETLQRHMRDSMARLRQPRSAETIADDIADHLHSGEWAARPQEAASSRVIHTRT